MEIYVDDIDQPYAELVEREAPLAGKPKAARYGIREPRVTDLAGHQLAFGEAPRSRNLCYHIA